jgi:hypothetical protein
VKGPKTRNSKSETFGFFCFNEVWDHHRDSTSPGSGLELCSLSTHGKVWNQASCQIRVDGA